MWATRFDVSSADLMKILRKLICVLLLSCGFAAATHAQSQPSPLRVTLKQTGSEYCVGDEELDRLDLKIRFVYENRGTAPVILYKPAPKPARIMVGRNLDDVVAERFELDFSITWYTEKIDDETSRCYNGPAPTDCFVTIAPGSSYEVEDEVRLFAVRGDLNDINGAVKSGEHALRLVVPTWDASNKLAQELERRWRSHGTLWSRPIKSEPLTFTVEKERKVVECK